jgi:DNA-directed RNA polymerase alpha subunit
MNEFDAFLDHLSVRSRNVILNEGICSLDELEKLTAGQLLRLPYLGRTSLRDIETAMALFNRFLADRPRLQTHELEAVAALLRVNAKQAAKKLREIADMLDPKG